MASVTLRTHGVFPIGATLAVFPAEAASDLTAYPTGSAVTTATVAAAGTATVTGLLDDTRYVAVQQAVNNGPRLRFRTKPGVVSGRQTLTPGNLGSAYTLDLGEYEHTLLVGTLNANCEITVTDLHDGATFEALLTQDATGGRTVEFTDADGTLEVDVSSTAGTTTHVEGWTDGDTLWIEP